MMGRSRKLAPSSAACRTVRPRTLSWLMYSTMITPVCTDTPINARNPSPDDTLKCVPVMSRLRKPPIGESDTTARINKTHFHDVNAEYRMNAISSSVIGTITASLRFARCWLSYSPVQSR